VIERVIIVDDDPDYGAEMALFLHEHGFETVVVEGGDGLFATLGTEAADIVLLDQRLRSESGIEVLKTLRAQSTIPCVMLTGSTDEYDRIVALELGADDHIAKTAKPREVLARIRAVLRRTHAATAHAAAPVAAPGPVPASEPVEPHWRLSRIEREVYRPDGTACGLTSAEFAALDALAETPGAVLSRDDLSQRIFGRPVNAFNRSVDNVILKLRRKIEANPDEPRIIRSVRLQGYIFTGFPGRELAEPGGGWHAPAH
jgi:DNA-binding response OmpR family regulator